jgi:hypothetical protein
MASRSQKAGRPCALADAGMSIPVLTLRQEFRSAALKGTAIELATRSKTGATQIPAAEFLNITYLGPTGRRCGCWPTSLLRFSFPSGLA